ncbi:MAG TPA: serine/threonine-protein kinase [Phycisphaerae bacterium]|nr:serine/threonine-protein kinase [Phycisphaerae bacterium]
MAFQFKQGDRPLTGYTIQRAVGRGGFGEVYYAMSDGGKEVALKFLRENPQIELRGVSHCLNLKSPYLVSIHDVRQNDEGDYFVIMEYVNGPSLRDLMNDDAAGLGAQKAAYLLREIAKGLAYLHDRGIVHRDLKPGNIFYEDGYVKIGDYGLAKIMAASQHSGQTVSVGTVHYMAPEVGSGNYDRTIDIYAMGVILYEMLLGRVPFAGATMGEVLMKHLTAQPEVDELPEPFPHVIRKSLAKDPKDRYQTVNEMIAEVFSVPALDQSVATFEAGSLSTIAARVARDVQVGAAVGGAPYGATVTTLGTGSSNVGQGAMTPTPVIPGFGGPPGRLGKLHNRIGARVERMAQRIDGTGLGQQMRHTGQSAASHGAKVTIALLLAAGISFAATLIAGEGNRALFAGIVFLHIVSIVQGVLVGTWWSYEHLKIVGIWVPRLIIAALACGGLVGTSALAESLNQIGGVGTWVRGLGACLILGDWAGRFYEGRKGQVSLGSAFSIGLCGFVAGIFFTRGGAFETAVIAAAASLVVQAVGSLWPLPAGAIVPKTKSDDEEEKKEAEDEELETPAPVAVEPPGFFAKVHVGKGATPAVPAAPAILAQDRTDTRDRVRRSAIIRSGWLLLSSIAFCGSVVLFAAPHLMETSAKDYSPVLGKNIDEDIAFFTMWGTSVGCLFLFLFTRSWSGYKVGFWRGILRPGVFFGGLALSACCGIAMGLLKLPKEAPPFVLGGILFGAISALFVWFVPVSPYRPRGRGRNLIDDEGRLDEQEEARRVSSRRLRRIAFAVFGIMCGIIAIVGASAHGRDAEEAIPPIAIIGTMASASLFYWSHLAGKPPKEKVEKLTLPLRRVFEVDANANLSRLIERHLTMFGYRLAAKSDLLWSFERGNWAHQFWHSDVRQWKLKLNIAAYELDTGGYRMTCYLDMDASFNQPDAKQLAVLDSELLDLKGLLGGRDAPSGGAPQMA